MAVLAHIKDMEHSLPFQMFGIDSDTGSEFLNNHLYRYLNRQTQPIRPIHPLQALQEK
jgi:hypothetical protein